MSRFPVYLDLLVLNLFAKPVIVNIDVAELGDQSGFVIT